MPPSPTAIESASWVHKNRIMGRTEVHALTVRVMPRMAPDGTWDRCTLEGTVYSKPSRYAFASRHIS